LAKGILGMQGDKVLKRIFEVVEEGFGGIILFFLVKILGDHCGDFGG
jgi:hypothetical protein